MAAKSEAIAIVTVHGTGDTATGPEGDKWYQQGSAFTERLKRDLAAQGIQSEIVPHLWSGANSASDRERGANQLAALIRRLRNRYAGVHVIGHSHGGNVANDAAVLLKWGLRRKATSERFDSLTTVGTPFFNVRTGPLQTVAGLLFFALTWASALLFPIGVIMSIAEYMANPTSSTLILIAIYIGVIGPSVWFMLFLSSQGVRRILRPRLKHGRTKTSIFSIFHENDEAISFLQRVETLPIEAFPRGSMFRGARGAAISIGVLAVIVLGVVIPALYVAGIDVLGFEAGLDPQYRDDGKISNTIAVVTMGLLLAPGIFAGIYWLYRLLIGGATEMGVRGSMNRFVVGTLRGIAMGRDGDQVLFGVSPTSHTHQCDQHVLKGDVAQRMQAGAHDAAGRLIDKYRWALFSVGGDSSASLTTLTTDAMTWDSLIHTTYFDQPEVADVVAAYIAAKAKGEAFTAPAPASSAPPPQAPPPEPSPPETSPPSDDVSRAA